MELETHGTISGILCKENIISYSLILLYAIDHMLDLTIAYGV